MTGCNRGIGLAIAALALALTAPAGAQENLDSGKTGAQLFAANCAACHKSPQALSKGGGLFGLSGFLREHYTSSRETAATIATYLESFGPAPGKRTGATKRSAKGDEKAKAGEKKAKPKSDEEKSEKPGKTAKPVETKTSGPKSSEPTTEPKSDEAKPKEPKAKDAKSSAAKPAAKPDKPEKSD